MTKEYLGDGVYVDLDDEVLTLTTEVGGIATNTIYLEPEVVLALMQYLARRVNYRILRTKAKPS